MSMYHEPVIPITARARSKYMAMFHESFISHSGRTPTKFEEVSRSSHPNYWMYSSQICDDIS
jgi:hypothetical protein